MSRLSEYAKLRIISMKSSCASSQTVQKTLTDEGVTTTCETVRRVWKKYKIHGTVKSFHRSGRPTKATSYILQLIDSLMTENDEMTASQLRLLLKQHDIDLSESSILRFRHNLGWKYRGAAYCQIIRGVNKLKWFEWAQSCLLNCDNFHDVIWSDESTIQLESHKRFCCRKTGAKPRNKPRPKHPVKVHVWGGISWMGRTDI